MVDRDRFVVGDAAWEKIASLLPGKASDRGVSAKDNRLFLEAVLLRGAHWHRYVTGGRIIFILKKFYCR